MDLTPYIDNLRHELGVAAAAGGEDARELAERLTAPLESATRLALLDALSAAADEITRDLAPGSVSVRLRGRDPDFLVTPPPAAPPYQDETDEEPAPPVASPAAEVPDDGTTSRINFRLPDQLKQRVEEAATAERLSVNAWLVRSVAATLDRPAGGRREPRPNPRGKASYTGWVR